MSGRTPVSVLAAAAFVCLALSMQVRSTAAQQKDPAEWLRETPLTLFDWGLLRLRRDISNAATVLIDTSLDGAKPIVGVYYDWRKRRIIAYLSIFQPKKRRTARNCRQLFARVTSHMMRRAPDGPGRASWYLETVFVPPGREWESRGLNVGDRLAKMIVFEVTLRPRPDENRFTETMKIACAGRLDAKQAQVLRQDTN